MHTDSDKELLTSHEAGSPKSAIKMQSVTLILLYRLGVQNGTLFYILLGVAVARLKKKNNPKNKKQKQKTTIEHKCEIIISNDF